MFDKKLQHWCIKKVFMDKFDVACVAFEGAAFILLPITVLK